MKCERSWTAARGGSASSTSMSSRAAEAWEATPSCAFPTSNCPTGKSSGELEELDLSEFHLGVAKPDLGSESAHISKTGKGRRKKSADTGSDHDILLDDLTVPPNPVTGSSSVIIGAPSSGGRPSDSDVRLVPDTVRGASDSDVQLASPGLKQPSDSDVTLIKEDTADHGVISGSGSSSETSVRVSPLLGSSAEVPAAESDSDFELNPSSELIDALQPDSGSDFELSALDASDEFEATPMSKPSDSDVTASDPKVAGINLSRPSDSGINLQTGAGLGSGPGRLDRAGSALRRSARDDPEGQEHHQGQAVQAQAVARGHPSAGRQEGRERYLRRHRFRGRCQPVRRRFRRQDRPARSRQRLRPGRQRHRLRSLRNR